LIGLALVVAGSALADAVRVIAKITNNSI